MDTTLLWTNSKFSILVPIAYLYKCVCMALMFPFLLVDIQVQEQHKQIQPLELNIWNQLNTENVDIQTKKEDYCLTLSHNEEFPDKEEVKYCDKLLKNNFKISMDNFREKFICFH